MTGVFATLLILVYFGVCGVGTVFWIIKLVEVAKIPDHQYRAVGTEKIVWVLVVALAGWIGALIWHFAKRRDVLAATGRAGPGWYPQADGSMRWWDGNYWHDRGYYPEQ